jgi:hypothetical protein
VTEEDLRKANEKNFPHSRHHGRPHVRQCYTGIQGVGEKSPSCDVGECGSIPSCVPYPAGKPAWDTAGGPTAQTCSISHPGTSCTLPAPEPYLDQGKRVGYQCSNGVVSCCVDSFTDPRIEIYSTLEDVARHQNCPAAIAQTSCPTCPPPSAAPGCSAIPIPTRLNCGPADYSNDLPTCSNPLCTYVPGSGCVPATGIPRHGKCVVNGPACAPGLTCVLEQDGTTGTCQKHP